MSDQSRVKADIVPYTADYARTVHSWIDSRETAANLELTVDYPPGDDVIETWQEENMVSYLLMSGAGPVAYGELWYRPAELAMQVRRLLVAPRYRDNGFGCKMLLLLCEIAGRRKEVAKVYLTVNWDNRTALGCYLKAGFTVAGTTHDKPGLYLTRLVERT